MAALRRILCQVEPKYFGGIINKNYSSAVAASVKQDIKESKYDKNEKPISQLSEYRFVFPEFLPKAHFECRNKVCEALERQDMLSRRSKIDIPEFYVGSVLAVTATDPYAPSKETRFVGICIARTYGGLNSSFVLRNVVDKQGIEIKYDMYNPCILSIDVLKLEKRLDEELYYLRDAPPEHSTFPFDMEPVYLPEGMPVPVNNIKVELKPPPWCKKWEQKNMKGIADGVFEKYVLPFRLTHARKLQQPWEEYDLMKQYRRCIPEEDQVEIWQDVAKHRANFPAKKQIWKRNLLKSTRK
ncbi:39S ribosomal protein L19, mitochondrial-like [Uloborus diversus]|uniref:39S ribosomal protein L19, mitochondrial-like n=1 Tax=Uloborus diversus TaxID=327109 RepID=UPI00240A8CC5|nr:39S ribosomal protein L19, mitochondrial-like [Uloborus diversus]